MHRVLTANGHALDVLTDRLHQAASPNVNAWNEDHGLKSVIADVLFQTHH